MEKQLKVGDGFKIVTFVLVVFGLFTIFFGFYSGEGIRTWANLLLNNYYFLSVAIGATFWMALQSITQSGWSAEFIRVPQAMSNYLIVSFMLWIFMFMGIHDLYHWTHHDAVMHDPILLH